MVEGLTNYLHSKNINTFGPSKEAAQLENDSVPMSDDSSGPDTSEMSEWERRLEGK